MLYFLWTLRNTHLEESHPGKRRFYVVFGACYTAWFVALPFIVILAAAMPAWYRLKVTQGMYLTINALGIWGLMYLLWPSRATEYFQIQKADLLLGGNQNTPYENL
jgi:hypothetical protein